MTELKTNMLVNLTIGLASESDKKKQPHLAFLP